MSEGKLVREASIEDLLAEPIVRLAMKADHFSEQEIRRLLSSAADAIGKLPSLRVGDKFESDLQEPEGIPGYRRNVGVVLLNHAGSVFIGRRIDRPAWQMPQGGIEDCEEPKAAALRELREEIGTSNATFLGECAGWFRYDLPPELVGLAWNGRWRGQEQKWFAMKFDGIDDEIDIATEHPEFAEWRWVPPERLPEIAAAFKRQVYLEVLREFSALLAVHAHGASSALDDGS